MTPGRLQHALIPTLALTILLALPAHAGEWEAVTRGVSYQRFTGQGRDIHVARIDLATETISVVASNPDDRGLYVSEYAKKRNAIVAINGDYFDKQFQPIGLSIGSCGPWAGTPSSNVRRQGLAGFGDETVTIRRYTDDRPIPYWVSSAVSGWPLLVSHCRAFSAKELPGSDHFTRAPHPRTAVGASRTGRFVYFVVADGRREGVPGPTLEELGRFMRDELGVCSALNLDGGGSSAMWVRDRIVNVPSDVPERKVGNHLAVVAREAEGCPESGKS
jgi:exopolysaccharide biosynthesis protein